jgi:phosphoadenosine phosphosulfate reductase
MSTLVSPLGASSALSELPTAGGTRADASASAIALYGRASKNFAEKLEHTRTLLTQAAQQWQPLTQASSLGAEDVVLSHLIAQAKLPIPAFVLQTGKLHPETLALLKEVRTKIAQPLAVFEPDANALAQYEAHNAPDAIYQSMAQRKACCQVRKLEPLERALKGQNAWLTGLRREQSGNRADVPFIDSSELTSKGRIKVNPLADWSWGDIWSYIAEHQVPYNFLHDQFYPSIGCAPCTRAIAVGEDFRAGRWWWEDETAKECGLHATQSSPA